MKIILHTLLLLILSAPLRSQARTFEDETTPPPKTPSVQTPSAPSRYVQIDLSNYPIDQLVGMARSAYQKGDYPSAIKHYYWALHKGHDGYYEMASYYALSGDTQAANYWLIKDATDGSPDLSWTEQDEDMKNLRSSEQWANTKQFISEMENYWHNSKKFSYSLIVPDGYTGEIALPTMVALHGKGDSPESFIHEGYQSLSNNMKVAFIGISGPTVLGKNAYAWTPDYETNITHIQKVMQVIAKNEGLKLASKALFGFSQGAQVSLTVAVNNAPEWNGALAMSPGLYPVKSIELTDAVKNAPPTALQKQIYIITNGELEHQYNLSLSQQDREYLVTHGAQVNQYSYPNAGHHFPADYYDKLPVWIGKFLNL
ncbi:MAG: alpha/beta hydrolase-fold protein [Gammaproteobacteria bacterium]